MPLSRFVLFVIATLAATTRGAEWVDISTPIVKSITDSGQKPAWPGDTAGVAVDPASGDVYLVVAGLGLWKSSDAGKSFERTIDGKTVGGRCETSFALQFDPRGKRLACFMLDGKCAWLNETGKWTALTDAGRNWDYAAVDWSADPIQTIFAAHHESGGQVMFSGDGGKTWSKLFKDAEFDKSGGLGVFDGKTLVYTQKGKGIQRSTDAGQTWTQVAEQEPIGRVVTVLNGKAYWLAKEGLLTSADRGETWKLQGTAVDASIGPYFDPKDDRRIVVAGAKGIFRSADGGESWSFVSKLPPGFEKLPKAGWFTNVAWDPTRDVFYTSLMGKATYRLVPDADFKPEQGKLPVPPPKGATLLLDESGNHSFLSMAGEKADWVVEDGSLVSTAKKNQNHIVSKLHFRDADLHVEFMLPEKGPGNSGVYLHGNYEVQIFNSFGKEQPTQEDAGAVYGFAAPRENACRPPGEWQVFDIRYRAPRRDEAGKLIENGTVTVWFNGKQVQAGAEVSEPKSVFHPFRFGNTPYLDQIRDRQKKTMTGPVFLQDHGNRVKFRNVWVLPTDEHAFVYEPPAAEPSPVETGDK